MGIVTKGLTAIALTFGLASASNAATYQVADDSLESKLCVAAATDSKIALHKKVKDFRTVSSVSSNFRLLANELHCNGLSVAQFAEQAGNDVAAGQFEKYESTNRNVEIRDIAKVSHGNVHIGSK